MYLSKITLEPSSQAAREILRLSPKGSYGSHQLLWTLFSDQDNRNFLFREELGVAGLPLFYTLSQTLPQTDSPVFAVQTKQFAPSLKAGDRLAYRLRANPTVAKKNDSGKSARHDVLMNAKRAAKTGKEKTADQISQLMYEAAKGWLADEHRQRSWGLTLDFLPDASNYRQHISLKPNGREIKYSSIDYEGVLTVTDAAKFLQRYAQGFGRAKAFGCGLMMLRKLAY